MKNLLLVCLAAVLVQACGQSQAPAKAAPPAPAAPAEPIYSQRYETCMGEAKGTTAGMSACIMAELKVEDDRLNLVYGRVMGGLDDTRRQSLRQAQRAWMAQRDRRCDVENRTGGTIDLLNRRLCLLDATIARTKEVEAMAPAG